MNQDHRKHFLTLFQQFQQKAETHRFPSNVNALIGWICAQSEPITFSYWWNLCADLHAEGYLASQNGFLVITDKGLAEIGSTSPVKTAV